MLSEEWQWPHWISSVLLLVTKLIVVLVSWRCCYFIGLIHLFSVDFYIIPIRKFILHVKYLTLRLSVTAEAVTRHPTPYNGPTICPGGKETASAFPRRLYAPICRSFRWAKVFCSCCWPRVGTAFVYGASGLIFGLTLWFPERELFYF